MTNPNPNNTTTAQEDAIRQRLLNSLGIRKPPEPSAAVLPPPSVAAAATESSSTDTSVIVNDPLTHFKLHGRENAFRQSLNDSREEQQRREQQHQRRPSRIRLVRFDRDVSVQPIASHKSYSKRIKDTVWMGTEELKDNAYRNQAEFAAEGWDYQEALEEEDMYVDAETGELVHPYWIEQEQ